MGKIDTVLKVVGVGAIVALGVPVALSVKYGNGRMHADELRKEFGISAWTIDVRSPREFSSLKAELFQQTDTGAGEGIPLGFLEQVFAAGRKSAEVRVYVDGQNALILCGGGRSEIELPFDAVEASAELEESTFYNLGGKGNEVAPRTFHLFKHPRDGVLAVEVTVE